MLISLNTNILSIIKKIELREEIDILLLHVKEPERKIESIYLNIIKSLLQLHHRGWWCTVC